MRGDATTQSALPRVHVPRSYLAVAGVVLLLMVVQTANKQWSTDWYIHASTVRELAVRPFHPHHPEVGTSAPDADASPYQLTLGLAVRASHLGLVRVLQLAAIVNLLALLVLLPLFVRCFTRRAHAPTWTLLFILVLWGIDPWRWSGYMDLNSIGFGLPYPATGALVLVFVAIILVHRWTEEPRPAPALVAAGLLAVAALTHPPTALPALITAAAVVVWRWSPPARAHVWHLAAGAALAVAILAAWPLYDFFALPAHSGQFDLAGNIYRSVPLRIVLLLVALPALWSRWRADRRDALALIFAATLVLYVGGWVMDKPTIGRTMPFLALSLQIALADAVAARLERQDRRVAMFAPTLVAVGALCCAPAFARFVPRPLLPGSLRNRAALLPVTAGYDFLHVIPRDDVVVVQSRDADLVEPAFGGKVLVPREGSAQFVSDLSRRVAASAVILSQPDSAEARAAIAHFRVRWLLLDAPAGGSPGQDLSRLGTVVHRDRDFVLVRLSADG